MPEKMPSPEEIIRTLPDEGRRIVAKAGVRALRYWAVEDADIARVFTFPAEDIPAIAEGSWTGTPSIPQVARMLQLAGIFRFLGHLFSELDMQRAWMNAPNAGFGGEALRPINLVLTGEKEDLDLLASHLGALSQGQ